MEIGNLYDGAGHSETRVSRTKNIPDRRFSNAAVSTPLLPTHAPPEPWYGRFLRSRCLERTKTLFGIVLEPGRPDTVQYINHVCLVNDEIIRRPVPRQPPPDYTRAPPFRV